MATLLNGRHHATFTDRSEAVLFLIGMRINRLRALRRWLPVAMQMPRMLAELDRNPELGLLGHRTYVSGRVVMVVQYWNSEAQLRTYARDAGRAHLPAWRRFNQSVRASGAVGIWHETYRVTPTSFETIYGDLPPFGLGAAVGVRPLARAADPVVARPSTAGARPATPAPAKAAGA
jgi:hypothetical protein